jgi:hypothetical protein
MNEFVNFQKRGIELPSGCKDLIDVLSQLREARIPAEGFADIERYLSRLLQSAAKRGSVTISSLDYRKSVRLSSRDGRLKVMVVVDTRDAVREQAVLTLFREAGIPPKSDYDYSGDGVPLRVLFYLLPVSVPDAAGLIRALLHKVHGLAEDAGLLFLYREEDNSEKQGV